MKEQRMRIHQGHDNETGTILKSRFSYNPHERQTSFFCNLYAEQVRAKVLKQCCTAPEGHRGDKRKNTRKDAWRSCIAVQTDYELQGKNTQRILKVFKRIRYKREILKRERMKPPRVS